MSMLAQSEVITSNATQKLINQSTQQEFAEESLRFLQANRTFLGREFLTWLWFVTESQNHIVDLKELGKFRLFLDDKLVLSSSSGSAHESVLKGGTPAYATEAHCSLLAGKLLHEGKFVLQDGERIWTWSMRADDLALRNVRLPSLSESEAGSHISGRLTLLQLLTEVVDTLYKDFMKIRTTAQFKEELKLIAIWMKGKATV